MQCRLRGFQRRHLRRRHPRHVSRVQRRVHAVEKVSEVASGDVPATSHPIPLVNVWREDVPVATLDRAEVLAQAPAAEEGRFAVPQILGEE